jgi:hypothetical protein
MTVERASPTYVGFSRTDQLRSNGLHGRVLASSPSATSRTDAAESPISNSLSRITGPSIRRRGDHFLILTPSVLDAVLRPRLAEVFCDRILDRARDVLCEPLVI